MTSVKSLRTEVHKSSSEVNVSHLVQVYPAITTKNNVTITQLQHGSEVLLRNHSKLEAFDDWWAKYHFFVLGKISGSLLFTSDDPMYVCIAHTN